jgi:hypothetical protein
MLTKDQINSLKSIYNLFNNVSDHGLIWLKELNVNDSDKIHIDNLTQIIYTITNITDKIEGELDDILIIVEENLKEYILQTYGSNKKIKKII